MLERKQKNDELVFAFSLLSTMITFNSKQGMFDLNKSMEDFVIEILNITEGLNLVNLNIQKYNHPAIDLGDKSAGVAYQITSDSSSEKVRHTVEMLVKHKLHHTYKDLRILIISNDYKGKDSFTAQPKISGSNFSDVTVLDLSSVVKKISNLSLVKFQQVYDYCRKEMSVYFPGNYTPLLKLTSRPGHDPADSISHFLRINHMLSGEPGDHITPEIIRNDLIVLKQKLSELNDDQRRFIFRAIHHTLSRKDYHFRFDMTVPKSVISNGKNANDRQLIREVVHSLISLGLAKETDDDQLYDPMDAEYSVFYTDGYLKDFEYFSFIARYLHENDKIAAQDKVAALESIIVECDFSLIH